MKKHISQIYGWKVKKMEKDDRFGYKIPAYQFTSGTEVLTFLELIDVAGKKRLFKITINDEGGVLNCRPALGPGIMEM